MLTNADLVEFCKSKAIEATAVFPSSHAVILKLGGMVGEYVQMARLAKKTGDAWMLANPGICSDVHTTIGTFKPDAIIYSFASSGAAIKYELQNGVPAIPVLFHGRSAEVFDAYIGMSPSRPSFLATSRFLDKMPLLSSDSAALHQTGPWRLDEHVSTSNGEELLAFLADGAAPVALGWGSMLAKGQSPQALLVLALRALLTSRRRGVIVGGWARLDELGKDFLHSRSLEGLAEEEAGVLADYAKTACYFVSAVPHLWLFPRCSCVVHHGGSGTTHAALLAGRPAVVTPIFFDQFDFSKAVSQLGVGVGFTEALPVISAEALAAAICEAECKAETAQNFARQMRDETGVGGAAARLQAFLSDEVVTGKWKSDWLRLQRARAEEKKQCEIKAAARAKSKLSEDLPADKTTPQSEAQHFLTAPRLGLPASVRAGKTGRAVEHVETEEQINQGHEQIQATQ